ncbi:MAG: heparinase II/III family protein [Planctomycetota bacterium]|nr:heparinase II/III family protein [Planctomycetota bacterium]
MATRPTPHPRLYVSSQQIQALAAIPTPAAAKPVGKARSPRKPAPATKLGLVARASQNVAANAEIFCQSTDFAYDINTHNAHLVRARIAQSRVVTLIVRFFQTDESRFLDAAMKHIEAIGHWEYWSWITWRKNDADPLSIFDLSYGENSTTLAIAYDWLHDRLDADRRAWFVRVARERSFASFLKNTPASPDAKGSAWWYGKAQSNWNTVCAGGAGMLALAMLEDAPEAAEVLERVERSIKPYFDELKATNGAWPEGIGYWNYGMRYGFMYLLSHERATGEPHPMLRQEATRKTLWFPLDFSPNGVPCSFGDVNSWSALPFHLATAQALGETALAAELVSRMSPRINLDGTWPDAAETLLFHPAQPTKVGKPPRAERSVVRLYEGLDWGVVADRLPGPSLYLAIRGGTTEVPHGHRDLTSYHCVLGDEALITNLGVAEYLDTTFSGRRWELFETMPASKNVVLISGVGVAGPSTVTTTKLDLGKGVHGLHIDATAAMGAMRDGPVAQLYSRAFLSLRDKAMLIVDHVKLPHPGRFESRFHTTAEVKVQAGASGDSVTLRGERQSMRVVLAASEPAAIHTGANCPTTPGRDSTAVRWCVRRLQTEVVMATLLVPGRGSATLKIEPGKAGPKLTAAGTGWRVGLDLADDLRSGSVSMSASGI